ncbi:MAG: sulfate reduction electron transfer complex DsrMKJOP subunit DsrJ [Smithellaceae bacterium]|nr:sulfate reduction electron transfer complex DsrMKJOP subunit DsrJ [Syntrophaceae bacterium]MDD4241093.1 sulfate reduction electron transfer complex DsrMKJOP subunit DsrJ [Smithellaceae bacterium]NLX52183.1 sulfate reduction electron transfer complex DsrMKJOP subunit DsrJ [Deltaproteobacteria bacterium]
MKQHKWGLIFLGLAIFVIGVTFPFWYGKGKSTPPVLSLETPEIAGLARKECVEDKAFMRSDHMKMLKAWRDEAVREGKRVYTAKDGRTFEKSLTGSCLQCHSNKEQFCDRCHTYVGAAPSCFDCHIVPGEVKK